MISQRAARPSGSVERLHQMCLSNLKGVDETKSPTELQSVFSATNLVNNLDGSFSVRKPLLFKRDWTNLVKKIVSNDCTVEILRVVPLHTETDYIVFFNLKTVQEDSISTNSCIAVYNENSSDFVKKCVLKWYDLNNAERTVTLYDSTNDSAQSYGITSQIFDAAQCSVFYTSTTTGFGNCNVTLDAEIFEEMPMVNTEMYDATPIVRQRYLQVYYSDVDEAWCVSIYQAEPNTFEYDSLKESYIHPLNTVLDDMYVLRDTYGTSVPAAKQIVPYVYTEKRLNSIVPSNASTSNATTVAVSKQFTINKTVRVRIPKDNLNAMQGGAETLVELDSLFALRVQVLPRISVHARDGAYTGISGQMYVNANITIGERPIKHLRISAARAVSLRISESKNTDPEYTLHTTRNLYTRALEYSDLEAYSNFWEQDAYVTANVNTTFGFTEGDYLIVDFTFDNITGTVTYEAPYDVSVLSVESLTESLKSAKFRGCNVLPTGSDFTCILKAFCNFPNAQVSNKFYATWLYSLDGMSWNNMLSTDVSLETGFDNAIVVESSEKPIESVDVSDPESQDTFEVVYAPFVSVNGIKDTKRVDVLKISKNFLENYFTNATFRFKIVLVDDTTDDPKIVATYGQLDYVPLQSTVGTYWNSDLGNSAAGRKLYHNKRIFSFGQGLKNNIFVSNAGEFTTPFENTIDLTTSEDTLVTAVVPWKDYLFISTPQTVYLSSQTESGFLTKTVNTSVGIPQEDSRCVAPTLNGIVFKAGPKLYMLYPNIYAGDDSVTNVTEISKPVEAYLYEHCANLFSEPFAFSTASEYVLLLPKPNSTSCLRYDYTTRKWNCLQYPIRLQRHALKNLSEILVFGQSPDGTFCEYYFDKTFEEAYGIPGILNYGDILVESENGITEDVADAVNGLTSLLKITPISFELDTGQKSDQILTKKQFVETKIVVATSAPSPTIDMDVIVHVDGDRNVTKNMSTDAAFWKAYDGGAVLNTTLTGLSDESDSRDVLRQLSIRYSGRGNSVRHILKGTCSSNFKLYETYIRYKLLNVK